MLRGSDNNKFFKQTLAKNISIIISNYTFNSDDFNNPDNNHFTTKKTHRTMEHIAPTRPRVAPTQKAGFRAPKTVLWLIKH